MADARGVQQKVNRLIQEIENASVDELQKVVGINYKLASKIRESLKK